MNHVELTTMKEKVPPQRESKAKERRHPPPSMHVEAIIFGNGNDADPGDTWLLTGPPLARR
jgi:hypothetical protein